MKRLFSLWISVLLSVAASLHAQEPGYSFECYDVSMTVHEDGSYGVTETIDADFSIESRGIFRMLPTWVWVQRDVSASQDGSATRMMHYQVDIEDVRVSEQWTEMEDYSDSLFAMRIGSPDVWLFGPHRYVIEYTLRPYADRVEQSDLLFYSLLGEGWDCFVCRFHFSVHFDKALTADELAHLQIFAGSLGSRDDRRADILTHCEATHIEGEWHDIQPRSALTLRIPLREGYFVEPLQPSRTIHIAWCFLAAALLLLAYVLVKEITHNDHVTKIISFYPPKDCSSADIGTLIDTRVDDRDILSLIPWFAEQGYITIDNTQKAPVLHKSKDLDDDAPKYLKILFKAMFAKSDTFDTQKADADFGTAWMKCRSSLQGKFRGKLNTYDWKVLFVLLLSILSVAAFNGCAYIGPESPVLGVLSAFAFAFMTLLRLAVGEGSISRMSKFIFILIALMGYVLIGTLLYIFFFIGNDTSYLPLNLIVTANALLALATFLASQLTFMTAYRKERIGTILGLHEFISTAEKSQLEHLQADDETYFYRVLPYAVAFGMATTWAKKFDGIMVKPADWYRGNDDTLTTYSLANMSTRSRMTTAFRDSQMEAMARQAAAQSSHGASSGSAGHFGGGGGGFAGGGFGGGGGGRW